MLKIGIYQKPEKLLTEEQEKDIEKRYYSTTSIKLAKEYGVSSSKISQIWMRADLRGKVNRTYYLNENYFENIDSDEKAYWIGFIASDGCIYQSNDNRQDMLSIILSSKDKKHLEKLKKALETNKPLSTRKKDNFEYVSFQISSNKISKDLQKIGITPRKTYNVQ